MKGFFKSIKNEFKKEINKAVKEKTGLDLTQELGISQDDDPNNPDRATSSNVQMVESLLGGLFGGSGGGSGAGGSSQDGLTQILGAIQKFGGLLPGNAAGAGGFLPGILKLAEVIGKGTGDQKPRTEHNPDGSSIDDFLKTIIQGRKIHAGDGGKHAKTLPSFGERGSGFQRGTSQVQDYDKIKAKCLAEGTMFEDPDFPAEIASIFYSRGSRRPLQWARPHEIVGDPEFFIEGASRFDVKQGELGDCWLLAAVANLTLNRELFHHVIPEDQSFTEDYCGIFHFRFWQYGHWVDVCVDDRLPVDASGRLVFMHSEAHNEMWSALLEKAYAKLHGSYEALKGGTTCEALEDFTGGVTEMYECQNGPPNLFKIMAKAHERSSFMGCSLEPDPRILEAEGPLGLIRGHAYSITAVKLVDIETPRVSGRIPLLRVRNPWGNEAEWKGAWSDGSEEWQYITDDAKEEMGLTFDSDGEFWMSFKDFTKYFQRVEICNLSPDSLEEEMLHEHHKKKWEMSVFEGAWVRGATAGGCRNYLETFSANPQYIIELSDPDEDDEDEKCTIIISLMQKNRRAQRKLGVECLTIGFAIYHIPDPGSVETPLPTRFFKYNASVARSPTFINLRSVSCRFKLPPGTYCIVPSTFEPNEDGEFIIRVFSEAANHMKENDTEVSMGEVDERAKEDEGGDEDEESVKRVRDFFQSVAGEDMEVDWAELKEVLDLSLKRDLEFDFEGFSKEVCKSMVALMDLSKSGKLGLDEFIGLWKNVKTWKNVFKLYDRDSSGQLSAFELRQALSSAGYHVNNHIVEILILRYGDVTGCISFDDFMMCSVKLKAMIEIFKEKDVDNRNRAEFTLDQWVEKTLYC